MSPVIRKRLKEYAGRKQSQVELTEQREIDLLFIVVSGCIEKQWEKLLWNAWQHELAGKEQMGKYTDTVFAGSTVWVRQEVMAKQLSCLLSHTCTEHALS